MAKRYPKITYDEHNQAVLRAFATQFRQQLDDPRLRTNLHDLFGQLAEEFEARANGWGDEGGYLAFQPESE